MSVSRGMGSKPCVLYTLSRNRAQNVRPLTNSAARTERLFLRNEPATASKRRLLRDLRCKDYVSASKHEGS